jgi:hypothetical protein
MATILCISDDPKIVELQYAVARGYTKTLEGPLSSLSAKYPH